MCNHAGAGHDAVSPGPAAAETFVECCGSTSVETGHASKLLAANVQLEKYRQPTEVQYNKKTSVQESVVGQCIGLRIPVAREKLDDKVIFCMIAKKHNGYSLRCEKGLNLVVTATDQLTLWECPRAFNFHAAGVVRQLKELTIVTAVKFAT